MALNTSGPIALAGATAGVSIAVELGLGTTTAISLNQAAVRTLAGVPSGAIIMPTNFYGKSNAPIVTTTGIYYGGETSGGRQNTTTRINVCGALIGSVTNVGTVRDLLGGARIGTNGVFYGGNSTGGIALNTVTRINSSGALVGSQTNVGTARAGVGGALIGSNGVYIGGCGGCTVRKTTIINACGALVGSEITQSVCVPRPVGAPVGSVGLYRSAYVGSTFKLNSCGTFLAQFSNVGSSGYCMAASSVGTVAMFYAGYSCYCCCSCPCNPVRIYTYYNNANRVNVCGALVGSATTVGTARASLAGSKVGSNALFWGGLRYCFILKNIATRINACGALVGSETTVGTAIVANGGASV